MATEAREKAVKKIKATEMSRKSIFGSFNAFWMEKRQLTKGLEESDEAKEMCS